MVESEANFLVLKHFFEDQVSLAKDLVGGSAIGLSTMNGGYKSIVMLWYWVYLKFFPGTVEPVLGLVERAANGRI